MKHYNHIVLSLALFFTSSGLHAMEATDKSLKQFESCLRSLPQELQSQAFLSLDAMPFLGMQPIFTLGGVNGHTDRIISVALNKDRIITGSCDLTAKIWNRDNGELLHTLEHSGPVVTIKISGDNVVTESRYARNSIRRLIKIWNIHTGTLVHELDKTCHDPSACFEARLEISGDKIVTLSGEEPVKIKIWNINTGELIRELEHTGQGKSLALEGDTLVIGSHNGIVEVSHNGIVEVWNISTGNLLHRLELAGLVTSVAVSDNKVAIGSGSQQKDNDQSTNLWIVTILDSNTGEVITLEEAQSTTGSINSITLHGNLIVIMYWDLIIKTFNIPTGRLLLTVKNTCMLPIALRNDKEIVIMCDGTATVWGIKNGTLLNTLGGPNGHASNIRAIAASENQIVTTSGDPTVKLWPLSLNLQEPADDKPLKPEDNPLLWIIKKADMAQLTFIKGAYEATIGGQEFVIDLPKKLNHIADNESYQKVYGMIYLTFPPAIQQYLLNRLRIRRPATWQEEVANVTKEVTNNCLIQ